MNKLQILVHCRSAQFAYSRQLADVHFLGGVGGVVLVKHRGDILFCGGSPSNALISGQEVMRNDGNKLLSSVL